MKEKDLDSLFKKAVSESNDFYADEADRAKERVWNQVKTKKQVIPLFYRILAVASILLLIFLSVMTYSNLQYKTKINQLVETNGELRKDNQILKTTKRNSIVNSKPIIDTVVVEKTILQSKPIVTKQYITDTVYLKQVVYVDKGKTTELSSSNVAATTSDFEENSSSNKSSSDLGSYNINSKSTEQNSSSQTDPIALNFDGEPIEKPTATNDITSDTDPNIETTENSFQRDIIIINNASSKKKKSNTFKFKFGRRHSKIGKNPIALSTKISI